MSEVGIKQLNTHLESSPPALEKRVYTVDEIQDILSIGRNAAYELVKAGQFHTVRIGGSIRISKKSFDAWLDQLSG